MSEANATIQRLEKELKAAKVLLFSFFLLISNLFVKVYIIKIVLQSSGNSGGSSATDNERLASAYKKIEALQEELACMA